MVELELHHLKRSRVPMSREIANQPAILVYFPGSIPIRNASRLHDREVGGLADRAEPGHDIHQRDHPMVVHFHFPAR
jgi:hypothetical protein